MKYLVTAAPIVLILFGLSPCDYPDSSRSAGNRAIYSAKGKKMISTKLFPFKLSETDLSRIEISYLYHSGKLGAGFQEIILFGNGKVRLKKNLNENEKPKEVDAKMEEKALVAILALMEEDNFLGLEDEYPPKDTPHGFRKLTLKLPTRTKTVILCEPVSPEFERIAGAIKIVAGIVLPQALGHVFFPNL